jgi:5'-nucleotidase
MLQSEVAMHILVTNDDGVHAPGLLALAQAMRTLGQVTVLAPDRNWSGGGHVKTMERPLRVRETRLADGSPALMSDGAPSDCVALALLGVVSEKIDLVVSGINPHPNFGNDVTYSGTVTAAMEAVIGGVIGIAFSLDSMLPQIQADFGPAGRVAVRVVQQVLEKGLPPGVLLNVNVPALPDADIKGFMLTRQGLRLYHDRLDTRRDPRGQPYYWIGGDFPTGVAEAGTDYVTPALGYVSITPLQLDLTSYKALETLKTWKWA